MTDTAFARQFKRAAGPNLVRNFGESIGYCNRAGSPERTISAMIERQMLQIIAEVGDVRGQAIIVRVRNDSTYGISSDEIDTGGDEVRVPIRIGEKATLHSIVRVLSDNAGLVRFLVQ